MVGAVDECRSSRLSLYLAVNTSWLRDLSVWDNYTVFRKSVRYALSRGAAVDLHEVLFYRCR